MKQQGTCHHCDEPFPLRHYSAGGRPDRYCSRACYIAARRGPPTPAGTKRCGGCRAVKPVSDFYANRSAYDGLAGWCIGCRKTTRRAADLVRKYKITLTLYNALLRSQHGKCCLCKKDASSERRPLAVDHDHKTGRVRGLLCWRCNMFLGKVEHRWGSNAGVLLAEYLR